MDMVIYFVLDSQVGRGKKFEAAKMSNIFHSNIFEIIWCKFISTVIDQKSYHFLALILRVPSAKWSNFWGKKVCNVNIYILTQI